MERSVGLIDANLHSNANATLIVSQQRSVAIRFAHPVNVMAIRCVVTIDPVLKVGAARQHPASAKQMMTVRKVHVTKIKVFAC